LKHNGQKHFKNNSKKVTKNPAFVIRSLRFIPGLETPGLLGYFILIPGYFGIFRDTRDTLGYFGILSYKNGIHRDTFV
jgi:hypothetical protein